MSITLAEAKDAVVGTLSDGLQRTSAELQNAIDGGDHASVFALTGLRNKYVFDQMKANEAEISAIDGEADTADLLSALQDACDQLKAVQDASSTANDWINKASKGIDTLFGAYSKLASF